MLKLVQYDKEAIHFIESIRDDKRKELEKEALQVLYPDYATMLRHLRSSALKYVETRFTEEVMKRKTKAAFEASIDSIIKDTKDKFEKESRDVSISKEWDASATRENLSSEIEKRKYEAEAKFKKFSKKTKLLKGLKQGIGKAGAVVAQAATEAAVGAAVAAGASEILDNSDSTANDLAGETFDNSPN
ncbi:PROTEIN SEY1 [Salix purpurea]|uniref:PROTEIN SEY1 n=1 Tax=Salix purpurea TaxID=77065 RepID=A0A9Q0ZVB7_SALPP|nr:PROTEIN SEY1 [Salix purpurea]